MLKPLLVGLIALLPATMTLAQTSTVIGKVTDEKNAAIGGATVIEKNTRNGTTTGVDGSFTIQVKPKAILVISYVGFDSYEVAASPNLHVSLNADFKNLTDVVVTGVGVATSKKKVAIDVATLASKDFAKSATTSIEQALTGQIAGVQVQQSSGQPGSPFTIILRGINTVQGTQPLIMVDGVEVKNLTNLDPATVDRIEVVKGAAGGTLYGAQGANGVIQIFTKRGTLNNKLNINLNSKVSIDNILQGNRPLLAQYHHYVQDASGNILDALGNPIKQDSVGIWSDPAVPDPTSDPATVNNEKYTLPIYNHLKQAFRQAITYSNSVNVNGGGPSSDYAFTASQLDQQDVFSNNFRRSNLSLNLGFQPFKGFTFRSNTQVIIGYNDLLNGNRFGILNAYPWVDLNWKDPSGHRALKTSSASNQLNSLSEQEWHQTNNQGLEIVQNFDFNYKFVRFVELDFKYGIDYSATDSIDYYLNQTADLQDVLHWGPSRQGSIKDTYARDAYQNALTSIFIRTDFNKDFHSAIPIKTTTQLTYDWRQDQFRNYFAQGVELPAYPPANISSATVKTSGDFSTSFITFGILVNQTIDYGNLFGISAGIRSDYSAEFGAASKPFTFPRGTIYFRPSEFLANSFLSDWKLRAAYGEAGIQPFRYQRQETFGVTTLGNGVGLSLPTTAQNDSLNVQISKELEIGTDVTITPFKGNWLSRVTFSGTYWNRVSSQIIVDQNVALSSGFSERVDNLMTIDSKGLDLTLDMTMLHTANVIWNMGLRWGHTQSIVNQIKGGAPFQQGEFALRQGASVGTFYGQTPLHSITQLEVDGKTPYIPVSQQGNYSLVNGIVVNNNTYSAVISASNDLSVIGKAYPDFTSSLINTVNIFKALTISFQFDWIHGNDIYNFTRQWFYTPVGGSGGMGGISKDFDQPITVNGKTGAFVNYYQSLYNLVAPLSTFVENGSYLRLRDLSVTYDLTNLIRVNWIKRLSATVDGRNLLTVTKYKGLDPEATVATDGQGNALNNGPGPGVGAFYGVDYYGIPNLRSYQFSLNIGF
jgi:TonB-dependent starch-binding outer membrane protein SusC